MYEKVRLISDFRKKILGCDSNPQKYYILWNRVKIINFPYFEFISVVGLGGGGTKPPPGSRFRY